MSSSSPFNVLGIKSTATPAEIKAAYRRLVKQWHPDRFPPGPQRQAAETQLTQINLAYNTLKALPTETPLSEPEAQPVVIKTSSYEQIYQQGADLAKAGRYEEAIEVFSRLIKVCPTHVQAYRHRGFARSILGLERGAESDLAKAKQLELARSTARETVTRSIKMPQKNPKADRPQGFLQRIWKWFKQQMRLLFS